MAAWEGSVLDAPTDPTGYQYSVRTYLGHIAHESCNHTLSILKIESTSPSYTPSRPQLVFSTEARDRSEP